MRNLVMTSGTVAALLVLAGCAKPLEVSSITEIKPQSGASGIDVYAAQRARGEKVPDLAGDQVVEVRTFSDGDAGKGQEEMAGATCHLSTPNFSADAASPAKVRVPIYRSQSSTLAIKCEKDGFQPKLQEVQVSNVTQNQRLAMGANGGLIGVALALAANGMSDPSNDDFKYPIVRVVMTPKTSASGQQGTAKVAASSDTGLPPH